MSNPYYSSGDTGSGELGINLDPHATGYPIRGALDRAGAVTSGHTWLIIVLALALLWLLGGGLFRSVRMS